MIKEKDLDVISFEGFKKRLGNLCSRYSGMELLWKRGYNMHLDVEYDAGYDRKPKIQAIDFAKAVGAKCVVYRITTHTYGQKYIEFWSKGNE